MTPAQLAKMAAQARESAYAPYSKFHVGAALLAENGEVYTGCNVENASLSLTICAERTAVAKAVSEGAPSFVAIAISSSGGCSPCGACRQVLHEFNPSMTCYLADETGAITHETTLDKLLPEAFGPENLD